MQRASLIALGAVAVLGEWIVSRSYTVGVGIGILGIFPLVGEIPVDLRFIGGAAVVAGVVVYLLGPRLNTV